MGLRALGAGVQATAFQIATSIAVAAALATLLPAAGQTAQGLSGVTATATSTKKFEPGNAALQPAARYRQTIAPADAFTAGIRPPTPPSIADAPLERRVSLARGDTLGSVLSRQGVPATQANAAVRALRTHYNPRRLQIGQELTLTLSLTGETATLAALELESAFDRYAGVTRYPDGSYRSYEQRKQWDKLAFHARGTVETSIFAEGVESGAPEPVMAEFLRLFSFDVDFQRDVHPGDSFELVYEQYRDRNGRLVRTGDLLFAALTLRGQRREYYRFGGETGDGSFYDGNGEGLRKALLRTPIDGARRSSGYGMRRHPILGYTKMHKGVDFAASAGTPIRAAGDGVLSFVGRQSGYGKFISIKHNDDYTTAYAHMSRFAQRMEVGMKVKQGQVIGYVGSTGRSTGPHLHYEVRYRGKQVNPSTLRLPGGKKLDGGDLLVFRQQIAAIDSVRQGPGGSLTAAARPLEF